MAYLSFSHISSLTHWLIEIIHHYLFVRCHASSTAAGCATNKIILSLGINSKFGSGKMT